MSLYAAGIFWLPVYRSQDRSILFWNPCRFPMQTVLSKLLVGLVLFLIPAGVLCRRGCGQR